MRIKIITVVTTFILVALVTQIKNQYFVDPSGPTQYYFTAFFIISIMLATIIIISMIAQIVQYNRAARRKKEKTGKPNLRECYRIIYEPDKTPQLAIRPNPDSNTEYTFNVLDISENGIKFLNDKNLNLAGKIEGKISFPDGETFSIDGDIIRKEDAQTILLLNSPIPYSKIIREQQDIIRESKSDET